MKGKTFLDWYSNLDVNPITDDVVATCVKSSKCSQCVIHEKCPIRPLFFVEDSEFELYAQMTKELVTSAISNENDEIVNIFINDFLQKRGEEKNR